MIYFLAADEVRRAKVGYAAVVAARVADLQTASPVRLRLMGEIEGGFREEAAIHRALLFWRRCGEWFDMDRVAPVLVDASERGVDYAIEQAEARKLAHIEAIRKRNSDGERHFRRELVAVLDRMIAKYGHERVRSVMDLGERQFKNVREGRGLPEAWRIFNLRTLGGDSLNELRAPRAVA